MKASIKLIAAMLIWGSLALIVRPVTLPSAQIVVYRIAFGFAALLLVALIRRVKPDPQALRRFVPRLLLSGACMGGNWVALFEAYRFVDVSIATLAYYCAPIVVMLGAAMFYHERLTPFKLACLGGAVLGMLLLGSVTPGGSDPLRGVLCGLISAILYAGVTLINKSVRGIDDVSCTLIQLLGAGIVVTIYACATGGGVWQCPTLLQWACLLVLGIVHTALALCLYFSAVRALSAHRVALCSYLDPVSALLFSAVFLNERMQPVHLIAAALILGSAALGSLYDARRTQTKKDR